MPKEQVNHPDHYNLYPIEVIDMMIAIWGLEKTKDFCLMSAFKYRMRLGLKENIDQDLKKEQWYIEKANDFQMYQNIENPASNKHPLIKAIEDFGSQTQNP